MSGGRRTAAGAEVSASDVVNAFLNGGKMRLFYEVKFPPADEINNFFVTAPTNVINDNLLCLFAHYCSDAILETVNAKEFANICRQNAENLFQTIRSHSYLKNSLIEKSPNGGGIIDSFRNYYIEKEQKQAILAQFQNIDASQEEKKQLSWGHRLRTIAEETRTVMRDVLGTRCLTEAELAKEYSGRCMKEVMCNLRRTQAFLADCERRAKDARRKSNGAASAVDEEEGPSPTKISDKIEELYKKWEENWYPKYWVTFILFGFVAAPSVRLKALIANHAEAVDAAAKIRQKRQRELRKQHVELAGAEKRGVSANGDQDGNAAGGAAYLGTKPQNVVTHEHRFPE